MICNCLSRREFIGAAGLAAATTMATPYVRTAHSAGRLTLLLWDHWVPGANEVMRQLIEAWAEANHVEARVDFVEDRDVIAAGQARARTGHDILTHDEWFVTVHKDALEPVDDVVAELISQYGPFLDIAHYLAQHDGVWRAVAAPAGSHTYPLESRLDLWRRHAGIELDRMFPAGPRDAAPAGAWTYEAYLEGAKALHAAGHPVGNPISIASDAQNWLAPLFLAFGTEMVGAEGEIRVNSDSTRAALEYVRELAQVMPEDVYAWDNASNNRWLISGRGSAIVNPPSAWAVAKRDQPEVATQIWHHDMPGGPHGRFRAMLPFFWGIWEFAENKSAAKDLLLHLSQKEQVDQLIRASQGYDTPLQPSFYSHEVWESEGPPDGTLYNYMIRGDEQVIAAGYPAPPSVAARIYIDGLPANLVARVTQAGASPDDAIAWAEDELESYLAR
jgi:hypothetical protein